MRALGLAAGLTGPAIEKIEKGKSVPRLDNVEALAKVLGVSPGWLAFGIGRGPDGKKHKPPVLASA
jgi:transcriptional regulator with XRE-family HTH domain